MLRLGGGRWSSRFLAATAVVLAVVGVLALVQGVRAQAPAPPQPSASGAAPATVPEPQREQTRSKQKTAPDGASGSTRRGEVPVLDYSRPVNISIPSLDVTSDLVELGLDEDGVMETPVPVTRAGWFRPSPPPGIPGATVIAGHVTWDQEPTVFFELGSMRTGDRVEVEREDGAVTVFEVTRIGSFPKDSFPTEAVYTQPERSELRLITCGGEYDEEANRYLDNVIVWAKIVGVVRA